MSKMTVHLKTSYIIMWQFLLTKLEKGKKNKLGPTKKFSCSTDFPDKNSEFIFFFFYENDEAKFFFPQKELVLIGCVQYMISWKYCAKL